MPFELTSSYKPQGDQPQAIDALVKGLRAGKKHQTLHGDGDRQGAHDGLRDNGPSVSNAGDRA